MTSPYEWKILEWDEKTHTTSYVLEALCDTLYYDATEVLVVKGGGHGQLKNINFLLVI